MVNIRIIMEKYKEYNIPLYMCFIDYAKAFDCVNHQLLWQDMHKMGFPVHVIELLEHLYKNQEAAVKTSCGTSEWFSIERGAVSILGFENCQSFFSYNCPCTYGVPQCAAHCNAQRAPV